MERANRWAQRPNKFGLLLLVLVVSYLLSAFASGTWVSVVQVALFLGITAIAVRTAQASRRAALLAIIVVTAGSAIVGGLLLADPTAAVQGAANAWKAALLAVAVVLTVIRVLQQPEVTIQSIYGALSAYMIIGLMFAACYGALDRFTEGDFFANGQPGNLQTFQYFSFTTLTTLGYGDFTAAQSGGRAVAVMEAMVGQVFLATLVARLVSAFRPPRQGPR
jgi:ion channel